MGRMRYDEPAAAAFRTGRHVPVDGLAHWRAAVARHLAPRPGMALLDLGAGTGWWAQLFATWFGVRVVAVEPSAAMRARARLPRLVAGRADALPLAAGSLDAVWLSTVVHHLADLPAAAAELRRVLRPGAPVLLRSVFAGRADQITLLRFFPEAIRLVDDTYPRAAEVRAVFAAAGFTAEAGEAVAQVSAPSLAAILDGLDRDAHTPLRLIDDDAYAAGLTRLRAAATTTGSVIDTMDLLVLR